MKIFKDKKVIILTILLLVFTIGYFVIANKVSYAFSNEVDYEYVYNNKLSVIKKAAVKYGEEHSELFNEENIIYIKVQDLIDNEYISSNNGEIYSDINKTSINSNVIKIKKENDKIKVEVDS